MDWQNEEAKKRKYVFEISEFRFVKESELVETFWKKLLEENAKLLPELRMKIASNVRHFSEAIEGKSTELGITRIELQNYLDKNKHSLPDYAFHPASKIHCGYSTPTIQYRDEFGLVLIRKEKDDPEKVYLIDDESAKIIIKNLCLGIYLIESGLAPILPVQQEMETKIDPPEPQRKESLWKRFFGY